LLYIRVDGVAILTRFFFGSDSIPHIISCPNVFYPMTPYSQLCLSNTVAFVKVVTNDIDFDARESPIHPASM